MSEEKPLSDFISSVEQVEVVEDTPPTEGSVKPVGKKSKAFPIIVGILLLFIIGMGGYYVYKQYYGEEEVEIPVINEEAEDEEVSIMDVSEYTDIKLVNYDGLNVSISECMEDYDIVNGIVIYTRVLDEDVPSLEQMRVVNRGVLTEEQISEYYLPVYINIKEKDIEADWLTTDAPWVLTDTPFGTPVYRPLVEINEVVFPNTDYTFAFLSLSLGNMSQTTPDSSHNFNIFVYAIKGDNIIGLQSASGNMIVDLGLSAEDSSECSVSAEGPDSDYLVYDEECLVEVFNSGEYNERMKDIALELIESFRILE